MFYWQAQSVSAIDGSFLDSDINIIGLVGAPVALELYKSAMDSGDDRGAYSYASMIHRGTLFYISMVKLYQAES
jgi:hypothetical protein